MFLRGGMYDVFKAGAYLNDIPHNFPSNGLTPYSGSRHRNLLIGDVPARRNPGNWSNFTWGTSARTPAALRVAEEQPVVLPRRRQPGHVDGTKVGSAANGTSPGNGFVDLPLPDAVHDEQCDGRGRLPDEQGTLSARLLVQQVRQRQRNASVDQPVLRRQPARHHVPAARQHVTSASRSGNYRDLPWRSSCPRATRGSKTTSDTRLGRRPRSNGGGVFPPTAARTSTPSTATHINQSFALAGPPTPVAKRGHPRVLQLDQAREQLDAR